MFNITIKGSDGISHKLNNLSNILMPYIQGEVTLLLYDDNVFMMSLLNNKIKEYVNSLMTSGHHDDIIINHNKYDSSDLNYEIIIEDQRDKNDTKVITCESFVLAYCSNDRMNLIYEYASNADVIVLNDFTTMKLYDTIKSSKTAKEFKNEIEAFNESSTSGSELFFNESMFDIKESKKEIENKENETDNNF